MSWHARRVLVTGATGIVGSWLVKRLLDEGASVVALVRDWDPNTELIRSGAINRTTVVNGCLTDYVTLERAIAGHDIDTVFHLGAQAIVTTAFRSPLDTLESNVRGTYNLLEACRVHRDQVRRVVVASSDKAYGESAVLPYTEDMPVAGRHPYDVSKSCADLLAMSYAYTYSLPIAIARCGNIYGGGDLNWNRIVPGTIRSLLRNERPILRSDGHYVRDYIYVQDVVMAYLSLAERCDWDGVRGEAFNFSPESRMTVIEIVKAIRRLMRRMDLEPVILDHARAEIREQTLDASKAGRLLHWRARHSFESGLAETIDWYQRFLGMSVAEARVEECASATRL